MYCPIDKSIVKKLRDALPNLEILTPESPGYEESLKRWNPGSERRAGIVVFPASAGEVSTIVRFSQENSLDIAFRCGGHSQRAASSTDGGVCVDLSRLCNVSVNLESKQVTVQGGATWRQVYRSIEKDGLAVVGGICLDVGVGGYTLIGGYGWLTGAHGLGLDNLVAAEVVLADGRIVTASESENVDLLWALKGAGPCFGVVTSMVLQGYKQGPVWAGKMSFPRSALSAVVEVANKVHKSTGEASMVIYWVSPDKGVPPMLVVDVFYNSSDESKAKEFFAPMLAAHPVSNDATIKPFSQSGDNPPSGGSNVWTSGSIMAPIDVAFIESLIDDFNAYLDKVPDAASSLMFWEIHSFHGVQRTTRRPPRLRIAAPFLIPFLYSCGQNPDENEKETRARIWAMNTKMRQELARRRKTDDGLDENTMTGAGEYINYDGKSPSQSAGRQRACKLTVNRSRTES